MDIYIFDVYPAGVGNIDAGDKNGRTPLMYCILGERLECAELLLKSGADVNKKGTVGRSALHWAALKVCDASLSVAQYREVLYIRLA